ncbi:hypothetical protein CBR_g54442 [Chara braunii]|uniref:Reverse transcriptase domain-containing protein n=1 Tax=Chara braunii TaxID=69332 RepID=A0A388MC51_CHABU|nr:hypothetical protein CBR_g54442 [Chara braunii]|eukprot:GBG92141.1 hypothetical protein CBR_g54442 [Chara braunii]
MTTEFRDLLDRSVLIYLDDILVYSRTLDEHIVHRRAVLDRLGLAKYKANLYKCEFAKQELEYLGHYVTPKGIRPLADKIQAIVDRPKPRCTTNVRSFMGLAGYYQRFVESYSKVAAPLSRLQSPKLPFKFDDAARGAFPMLKAAMQAAPALHIYDPTLPTQVITDASGYGIGAVLEQCHEDGWHPVEYFSQKVPPVNTLDDARKKELLTFVTVLKRWSHFLLGRRRFKWNTDNNPLTFYKTQDTVTSTIGRWMYYINQFDFDPCHIPDPANRVADALSRRPDFCAIVTTTFNLDVDLQPHFIKGYKSDPTYSTLYAELSSDHPPTSHYRISDGFLLLHTRGKDLLVVPQDRILQTCLFGEFHDTRLSAHVGVNRTLTRLRQRFHWPDVLHDVTRYIESCAVCHRNKGRSRVPFGELKPLPIPRALRLSIAMDVTGPFPRDRLDHYGILTVVDRLSKYARFLPCKYHAAAPELARLLHTGRITNQGVPEDIAADIDVPCYPASVRKYRDLLIKARANMQKAQIRMQQQANRRRLSCPFREGDLVWVLSEEFALEQDVSRKLLPKWFGPWEVTSAVGDDPAGPSFVVNISLHVLVHQVFHALKLAIYTPPFADEFSGRRSQDPPSMDGHQEVDRVITHRKYGNKPMQFKVTFKQCAPGDTWWISSADLQTSAPLIFADYEKRRLAKEAARPVRPTPALKRAEAIWKRRKCHKLFHAFIEGALACRESALCRNFSKEHRRRVVIRQALRHWRKMLQDKSGQQIGERRLRERCRWRLLRRGMRAWREYHIRKMWTNFVEERASRLWQGRMAGRALRAWKRRAARKRDGVERLWLLRRSLTLSEAYRLWKMWAEKARRLRHDLAVFSKRHQKRVKRRAFGQMKDAVWAARVKEDRVERMIQKLERRTIRSVFQGWGHRVKVQKAIRESANRVKERRRRRSLAMSFQGWINVWALRALSANAAKKQMEKIRRWRSLTMQAVQGKAKEEVMKMAQQVDCAKAELSIAQGMATSLKKLIEQVEEDRERLQKVADIAALRMPSWRSGMLEVEICCRRPQIKGASNSVDRDRDRDRDRDLDKAENNVNGTTASTGTGTYVQENQHGKEGGPSEQPEVADQTAAAIPAPRGGHSAVNVRLEDQEGRTDSIVIYGGYDGRTWFDDVHVLHTEEEVRWSNLPSHATGGSCVPCARTNHAACAFSDRRILVFGGYDGSKELGDLNVLTISPKGGKSPITSSFESFDHAKPFLYLWSPPGKGRSERQN